MKTETRHVARNRRPPLGIFMVKPGSAGGATDSSLRSYEAPHGGCTAQTKKKKISLDRDGDRLTPDHIHSRLLSSMPVVVVFYRNNDDK